MSTNSTNKYLYFIVFIIHFIFLLNTHAAKRVSGGSPNNISETKDDKFPLARIYLENKSSFTGLDYNQTTSGGCQVDYEVDPAYQHYDQSLKRTVEIKKWCSQTKVFYRFKKIKYSGCQWLDQESQSSLKSLGVLVDRMKEEVLIKNLEVVFEDKLLLCRGDLVVPSKDSSHSTTVPVEGFCAPVASSEINTQGLPEFQKKPLVSFLKVPPRLLNDDKSQSRNTSPTAPPSSSRSAYPLQASIESELQKKLGKNIKIDPSEFYLKISLVLPVSWQVSQDVTYLLSKEGTEQCKK